MTLKTSWAQKSNSSKRATAMILALKHARNLNSAMVPATQSATSLLAPGTSETAATAIVAALKLTLLQTRLKQSVSQLAADLASIPPVGVCQAASLRIWRMTFVMKFAKYMNVTTITVTPVLQVVPTKNYITIFAMMNAM